MLGFLKAFVACACVSAPLIASPVAAAVPAVGRAPDLCFAGTFKQNNVFRAEEALHCLSIFKVDRTYRTQQITALKGYLNLYPYLHLQKTGPNGVDVMKELDRIANDNSIQLEVEFHTNVSFLLNRFRDSHAVYTSACFNNIVYRQPWSLEAVHQLDKPSATPRIFVRGPITDSVNDKELADKIVQFYVANSKTDIRSYRGWEVTEINGKSAYDSVRNFSDTYSRESRDPNSRFNAALLQSYYSKDGRLVLQDGEFVRTNVFPWGWEFKKIYKLVNPKTGQIKVVTAPWVGEWRDADVQSMMHYYKNYCEHGGSHIRTRIAEAETAEKERSIFDDVQRDDSGLGVDRADTDLNVDSADGDNLDSKDESAKDWESLFSSKLVRRSRGKLLRRQAVKSVDWFQAPEDPSQLRIQLAPAYTAPYVSSYVLEDSNVGVFKLGTFSLDDVSFDSHNTYLKQITEALQKLVDSKVKKVILDFSGNGGGMIINAIYLLKALFPEAKFPRFDMRLSKEMSFLLTVGKNINGSLFNLKSEVNTIINTTRTLDSDDPYSMLDKKSINMISRGGVREPYTGPFELNPTTMPKFFEHPWRAKDIIFLSNGLCGSTCALLSRALRNSAKVRHYVYGGFSRKPFQPSSYEGGRVNQLSKLLNATTEVLEYAKAHRIPIPADAVFPKPFKLPVEDSQILMSVSYSTHGGNVATPDEFVYHPADGYVQVERPAEIVTVWRELARMLAAMGENVPAAAGEVERAVQEEAARRWGLARPAIGHEQVVWGFPQPRPQKETEGPVGGPRTDVGEVGLGGVEVGAEVADVPVPVGAGIGVGKSGVPDKDGLCGGAEGVAAEFGRGGGQEGEEEGE
ncbi:hypothetical protein HDU96_009810 [Phlyctochytrium bullatum]|nr:hypothetical protein HDU96_009810 [Phlyctochytrium bullatum]